MTEEQYQRRIRQLERKIRQLERIECKKAYFYGELCHDLRQPLQAMKIFLALLREENLTEGQADLVAKAEASAHGLEAWLDNLLAVAGLEAGGLRRQDAEIDLSELLMRVAGEYKEIAAYKNWTFEAQGEKIKVKTDAVLLERVIRNLLHNAFKYGRGRVMLRWYAIPDRVKITVKDNGSGLNRDECRKLFRAFYQCPRDREQGTGLGLAIVKELTDILGIRIQIKSKRRRGTIFILTLYNAQSSET